MSSRDCDVSTAYGTEDSAYAGAAESAHAAARNRARVNLVSLMGRYLVSLCIEPQCIARQGYSRRWLLTLVFLTGCRSQPTPTPTAKTSPVDASIDASIEAAVPVIDAGPAEREIG